jgi:hypothetical protein
VIQCIRKKSFKQKEGISIEILQESRLLILREAQNHLVNPMKDFRRQGVIKSKEGLWAVGARNSHGDLQILIPRQHPISTLLMNHAHVNARHTGRDSTLAEFRSEYYVSQASKLATRTRERCTLCRITDRRMLTQQMGKVPLVSLKPAPVFNCTQLDLFGPWSTRGEVQKRTTGKCWGCLFVCMASKAVHIEIIVGYTTDAFLMGLSRFGHLRGWPSQLRSDPGSQLSSADKELQIAWDKMDKAPIQRECANHKTEWQFSPADSAHYQGVTESLIRTVKRAVKTMYGHNRRLSFPEYATLGYTVADMINSRPLGVLGQTGDVITVLTPNALILGRNKSENPRCYPEGSCLLRRIAEVNQVVKEFWESWIKLCRPALTLQKKWNTDKRNLQVGDVVLVTENDYGMDYRLAKVTQATAGADGKVRSVKIVYKKFKSGEQGTVHYTGSSNTEISRSIHKLVLIVPVDEIPTHMNEYSFAE